MIAFRVLLLKSMEARCEKYKLYCNSMLLVTLTIKLSGFWNVFINTIKKEVQDAGAQSIGLCIKGLNLKYLF